MPGPPLGVGWDRLGGWRDQYDRMVRWKSRLVRTASDSQEVGAWDVEFWDTAMAFFQNAYHVRDWIVYELPGLRKDLDREIGLSEALAYCADIANGTKHRELNRRHRVPGHLTGVRAFAPHEPSGVRHLVIGPDGPVDVLTLASRTVEAWDTILAALVPAPCVPPGADPAGHGADRL